MFDLLTEKEDEMALARGWTLEYVFDCKLNKLIVLILPRAFQPPYPNAEAMGRAVVAHARTGDQLSVRALHLMQRGFVPKTRKKK